MRVFWALIGIVILLGAGYAATGEMRADAARERAENARDDARAASAAPIARPPAPAGASPAPTPPAPMPEATATTSPRATPMPEVAGGAAPAASMPTVLAEGSGAAPPVSPAPLDPAPLDPAPPASPASPASPAPLDPAPTAVAAEPNGLAKTEPSLDAVIQSIAGAPSEPPPPEPAPAPTPAAATPDGAPAGDASAVTIEARDDGAKVVDGRFVLKGEGTREKPYEISWEHLVSASEVYDPRLGKKELPGRVTMLEGKWVTITGYVAFPLNVQSPRELLSMLNQWDGCCLGVPPTPYDAVEVRLARAVLEDDRFATFGNVTGKFSATPYVVGDWLVGLYLMDEAAFRATEYGGLNPNPNPEGHVPGTPR